jgi:hypothetical protein
MTGETTLRTIIYVLFIAVLVARACFGRTIRRANGSSWFVQKEAVEREGRWSIVLRLHSCRLGEKLKLVSGGQR